VRTDIAGRSLSWRDRRLVEPTPSPSPDPVPEPLPDPQPEPKPPPDPVPEPISGQARDIDGADFAEAA
jgi:hypothetical protein